MLRVTHLKSGATDDDALLAFDRRARGAAGAERGLCTACARSPGRATGADPQWLRGPAKKVLQVDDISVVCTLLSEVTTSDDDFHKFGVEATAFLRITYPVSACPEPLNSEDECPVQDYMIGTVAAHGLQASFVVTDQFGQKRSALLVGAGRVMMNVFASAGAKLLGNCEGGSETNIHDAEISVGTGRLSKP